jgi:hypothetical protein
MKRQTKGGLVLILAWTLSSFSTIALAAGESRLRLSVQEKSPVIGQEINVDVLVENAPAIFGADVQLIFDPAMLQVVDADNELDGTQPAPGDFIDPQQSFFLQDQADNQAGSIDYALTLVHPALAVQGDGLLTRVTFQAKMEGQTTIYIQDGLFGTQDGEMIVPLLEEVKIDIAAAGQEGSPVPEFITIPTGKVDDAASSDDARLPLPLIVLGLGVMLALAGLMVAGLGAWFWLSRKSAVKQ